MLTVTFYSYKGGVGRTLAVANVVKYLARFGQRVFAIDFDLEAPGLHYKLMLGQSPAALNIQKGLVDYVDGVISHGSVQGELRDYVVKIEERQESGGTIYMMPAGRVPSSAYWRTLARVNWHDLFYADDARGVPLFLDLKARIERDFEPDVIVIDARTGITEMGGVATTLLPDKVVCLLMHNIENLEGARAVLRSIKRTPRLPRQKPVEVIPVLTRIPKLRRSDTEERLLSSTREFLNEQAEEISDTLSVSEVFILHSETALEVTEELRIGGGKNFDESPLLRDYLRLFSRLIPRERIEPQLGRLVNEALDRALDDPDGTQRELEALSASYPHSETYRALLKFYRLRRADDGLILTTASRLWDLLGRGEESLLWEVAREHFRKVPPPPLQEGYGADFLESVWRSAGASDDVFALKLADFLTQSGEARRAGEVLRTAVEVNPEGPVVVAYMRSLRRQENWANAFELIEKYRVQLAESSEFLSEWANVILGKRDQREALRFVEGDAGTVRLTKLGQETPLLSVRLLELTGRRDAAESVLSAVLGRALAKGPSPELAEVGVLFEELDRSHEFETKVVQALGTRGDEFIRTSLEQARMRRRFQPRRTRW